MSVYILLIVLIMFNSRYLVVESIAGRTKIIKLDNYAVCELPPDSPFKFDYINVEHIRQYTVVNMKFTISRDLDNDALSVEISGKRCASKEALDSCESIADVKPQNICTFIKMKGAAWTPWINSYKPAITCPIKKGTYIQTNGTIGANILQLFPLEGYYWNIIFKLKENNKLLYALCGGLRIGYV